MSSAFTTFNTTTEVRPLSKAPNPQLHPTAPQYWLPTAPGMCSQCVCVCLFTSHCCVCALGWVKCRAQIYITRYILFFSFLSIFILLETLVTRFGRYHSNHGEAVNKIISGSLEEPISLIRFLIVNSHNASNDSLN